MSTPVCTTVFTPAEAAVWTPRERVLPSQWIESNRTLSEKVSAEPGAYRFSRCPWWREPADLMADRVIQEIICLKSRQVGWTTFLENAVAECVDQAPGPALLILPTGRMVNKFVRENITPLIEIPILQAHSPKLTKEACQFDSMDLFFARASSANDLSSRPIRYVLGDECDRWSDRAGKDSDPVSMALGRQTSFRHNRKALLGSTPTTKDRHMFKLWDSAADRRHWHIPCPHCGKHQQLLFPHLHWEIPLEIEDNPKKAEWILAHPDAVQYACVHCGATFTNAQKNAVELGMWVSEGQRVVDGVVVGDRPRAVRVAFQISALYSPWMTFAEIVAEFLRATGDPMKLKTFRNEVLAEFWEEVAQRLDTSDLAAAAPTAPPQFQVPSWTKLLLGTADVHGVTKGIYYTIRAWGPAGRSQLITAGIASTFSQLKELALDRTFAKGEEQMYVSDLYIDARYSTSDVYAFCDTNSDRVHPVMGESKPSTLMARSSLQQYPGVTLYRIHTNWAKSQLVELRKRPGHWAICQLPDEVLREYLKQLAGEHQVLQKNGKLKWQPVSVGFGVHFLDCEVYQIAAAICEHHVDQIPADEGDDAEAMVDKVVAAVTSPAPMPAPTPKPAPPPPKTPLPLASPANSWLNSFRGRL